MQQCASKGRKEEASQQVNMHVSNAGFRCSTGKEMHSRHLLDLNDTQCFLVGNAGCKQKLCMFTGKLYRAP